MKLFSTIAAMLSTGSTVSIIIRKNSDGRLVVSTVFRNENVKDEARDQIVPFNVSGTPEELDAEYLDVIGKPLELSKGLQTSMENFEAQQKIAEANSREAKAKKDAIEKEKREKENKGKKLKDEADKLLKDKKYNEATSKYEQALKLLSGKEADDAKKSLEECKKHSAPDIFYSFDDDEQSAAADKTPSEEETVTEEPKKPETSDEADPEDESEPENESSEDPDPEDFD